MHSRVSVDSICFIGTSFAEQAEFWKEIGAPRVSLLGHQVEAEGVEAAKKALDTGRYRLETVVHPFLPAQSLSPDPATWVQPQNKLNAQIDAATKLGARSIYMITGGHGGMTWEQAAEVFCQATAPCVQRAKDAGIALMIENAPLLYADIHIAHSLRDTLALANMAGIGVCIDLSGCWTEAGLQELIQEAVPYCSLVQVADYVCGDRSLPARAVPGDGDMPLERLLGWIMDAGYEGAFDLELLGPRIEAEGQFNATKRAANKLSELLVKLDKGER